MQFVHVAIIYQDFNVMFNSIYHPLHRKSEAHTFTTTGKMTSNKYYLQLMKCYNQQHKWPYKHFQSHHMDQCVHHAVRKEAKTGLKHRNPRPGVCAPPGNIPVPSHPRLQYCDTQKQQEQRIRTQLHQGCRGTHHICDLYNEEKEPTYTVQSQCQDAKVIPVKY